MMEQLHYMILKIMSLTAPKKGILKNYVTNSVKKRNIEKLCHQQRGKKNTEKLCH